MKLKKTPGRVAFQIFNVIFMWMMILVTLYPILYIVFASFSDPTQFLAHRGVLLRPLGWSVAAYQRSFTHPLIMRSYLNTIIMVVVGTVIQVVLTAIGAYFMSRRNVMYRRPISLLIIFTMFFSGGIVPFYLVVRGVGLYDSFWSMILPTAVNTFNLIVMKTGFETIPDSLEESMKIDGAGHFRILFQLLIPLALPTLAVVILYYGVANWNSWFNASIFLRDSSKFPLQLVLRQILIANATDTITGADMGEQLAISETIKYSTIVIATLPIMLIYPFLQKYFVKGIMVGAVKG